MRKALIFILFSFLATTGKSQSIGIGTNSPDSSAQLDVFSNNKGFLPPRVALEGLNVSSPVTRPAAGLLVYNTATAGIPPNNVYPGYYYWDGSLWSKIGNSNSHQLPGYTVKNLSEALPYDNTRKTIVVPPGKVWKLNYFTYGAVRSFGTTSPMIDYATDRDKIDILLNQNDSFSVSGPYFLSIAEYPVSAKTVKTFDDSLATLASKTYVVPAHKIWKLNFCVSSGAGAYISTGTSHVRLSVPNLYYPANSSASIIFAPDTEFQVTNESENTAKYFLSITEYDE